MTEGSGRGQGRATVIVLFTDLVGSTELRSQVGEDEAEELRRTHDHLVADALRLNRGQLVKSLGDGVMATFAGAGDAVAAAVAIQQAFHRHNRSGRTVAPLEVRIGLSAGDVTFEGADCFGTPVIEAARLCAASMGGRILVTDVVRLLAGLGLGHRCTPVGDLDLKGLPAPVATCEVGWEPEPEPVLPLPSLLAGGGRIFVGRDEDLGRLTQLWKEAAAGECRIGLLAGEPGMGKTRLAAELAKRVHGEGAVVLAGRCDEDLGVPYQPFVEAVRQYTSHVPDPRLGRLAGELVRLVPELADAIPGLPAPLRSDPETERYRLFDAVAAWLGDASTEAPVLLVLDDLHWAAKPTLLLLRHVLRSSEPLRLLVVVTYRDTDVGRGHPLSEFLADLRKEQGVERFPIIGLDRAAVAAYIEAAAGHSLPEEDDEAFVQAVWVETGGNPFFVAEVVRHLAESGAIERRDGRWTATAPVEELGIPEGVRDVVGRRLSRLSEEANRVLAVAAMLGLEFEPAVVRAAGGFGEEALFSALEAGVAARLLVDVPGPVPRNRFAHALVRATLYDELSAARRVALHQRVAEAIEAVHAADLDDYLPALAHHWGRASAPAANTARAVDYAARAGGRAAAQLAHDEAAGYYRQALELLDAAGRATDEDQRLELLISLGEAQRDAGDPAYREILLDAARRAEVAGDTEALTRAALANSRGGTFSAAYFVDEERVRVLEAALGMVGDAATVARARLLASLALELTFAPDAERRLRLSNEALAIARRLHDPDTLATVLAGRFLTTWNPSNVRERLENTAELLQATERALDPVPRWWGLLRRSIAALEVGNVDEADACLGACDTIGASLRHPVLSWYTTMSHVPRLLAAGRLDEAERVARLALERGEAMRHRDGRPFFAVQLWNIRLEQGHFDEVEDLLVEAVRQMDSQPLLRLMQAIVHMEAGKDEEAAALFRELADAGFTQLPDETANIGLLALTFSAVLCARLGDSESAGELHDLLAPFAGQFVTQTLMWFGPVSHYLGLTDTTLGRFDEAEAHFSVAADMCSRIQAPTGLARTHLEWARMLLARGGPGDDEQARDLLGQALAAARSLGMAGVERQAAALLN